MEMEEFKKVGLQVVLIELIFERIETGKEEVVNGRQSGQIGVVFVDQLLACSLLLGLGLFRRHI